MDPDDECKLCLFIVFHNRGSVKADTSQPAAAAQLQATEWYYYAFHTVKIIIPLLQPAPAKQAGFLFCDSFCEGAQAGPQQAQTLSFFEATDMHTCEKRERYDLPGDRTLHKAVLKNI